MKGCRTKAGVENGDRVERQRERTSGSDGFFHNLCGQDVHKLAQRVDVLYTQHQRPQAVHQAATQLLQHATVRARETSREREKEEEGEREKERETSRERERRGGGE